MSAAAFVLAINLFVAAIFATVFGIVAAYHRTSRGAVWLALGYGTGMATALLEFILPYQEDHRLVSFGIFATFLGALLACITGLAFHYQLKRPWLLLALLAGAALVINVFILDMPHDSLVRGVLYQGPYALAQMLGVYILLGNRRWRALDLSMLVVLVLSSLYFLGKPILTELFDPGPVPQDYLASSYAAYSQASGAVLLITFGLVMLLIIVRDIMAELTAQSETDSLSRLLNRRGFEDHGREALRMAAQAGVKAVMILADLDHFKSINDRFGHAAGDRVIASFATILRDIAQGRSVAGRMGGEEFAVLLPGANLMTGRLYAETARAALANLPPATIGVDTTVTAAFGIAALRPGDTLSDLLRRADAALYQAKTEGRNRVCLFRDDAVLPVHYRGTAFT